jgi:hypothetical protein
MSLSLVTLLCLFVEGSEQNDKCCRYFSDMYKLVLQDNVVSGLRLLSLALFLVFAIQINIKSIVAAVLVLGKCNKKVRMIFQMSTPSLIPNRVLIVDKRLVPGDSEEFHFIQLPHPRTKQEQSYTVDHQSKTIFELIRCTRSHSSWFINDQHVLPDGSLYIITPVNLIFLLLPSLWSHARTDLVPLKKIVDNSIQKLQLENDFILEKLHSICDINPEKCLIKLNEDKLIIWLHDRLDRLKKHVEDEEHAFDLVCEYLPDEIVEQCQQKLNLHGNIRYDIPIGQKASSVVTKKIVEVTTTTKRSKK